MQAENGTSRQVTIYDVARRAGVSASTVSRAFSRPDQVSFATAEKVRLAAMEVGYRTELSTRVGESPPTDTLGLIVADITNPFFHAIIRGADHAAAAYGKVVVTADIHESTERALTVAEKLLPQVSGIMLASSRLNNSEVHKIARHKPTVVINRPVPGVPSVAVDNQTGMQRAVTHLQERGATSFTYLAGPERSWADQMRWRGLVESGVHATRLLCDEPTLRGGRRCFARWAANPTDAVLCFNDLVAIGFIAQAQAEGVRVPEDVLVVGFDNSELATLTSPSLTTVASPLYSVGRVAAANVMALASKGTSPLVRPRFLPTRLIIRESSSPRIAS